MEAFENLVSNDAPLRAKLVDSRIQQALADPASFANLEPLPTLTPTLEPTPGPTPTSRQ